MTEEVARLARSSAELLVLCAGNPFDDTKVADQHLAEWLAEMSPVLYVDPPTSVVRLAREVGRRPPLLAPRRIGSHLWRFTPLVGPYPARRSTLPINTWVLAHELELAVRRLGHASFDLVSAWPLHDLWNVRGVRARAYWAQDDFVGLAEIHGQDQELVAEREAAIAGAADVVVAANPLVAASHSARGLDVRLIPFGCDPDIVPVDQSGAVAGDVHLARPCTGVIGRFNRRTDLDLLEAVAERWPLLLVGPVDDDFRTDRFGRLVDRPAVQWVGPRAHGELAPYYRSIAVGLVPYADTAFNRGSFPLKLLEYLGAGLPVVSTDLPATRWLDTPLIHTATNRTGFVAAVERVLGGADPGTPASRREFARRHGWESRARQVRTIVDEARGRGRPGPSTGDRRTVSRRWGQASRDLMIRAEQPRDRSAIGRPLDQSTAKGWP
jgi:glycosyltransferase involved in cell wall biosynthesis